MDFPGYGYARRTPMEREKLAKMILWYLKYSHVIKRVVLLIIDAKVGVTAFDIDILRILREEHIAHIIIANKIDNIPANKITNQLRVIREAYGDSRVYEYSSKKNIGRKKLLETIFSFLHSELPS